MRGSRFSLNDCNGKENTSPPTRRMSMIIYSSAGLPLPPSEGLVQRLEGASRRVSDGPMDNSLLSMEGQADVGT